MRRLAKTLIAFFSCFGCSAPTSELAGRYVGWMFMDGEYIASDGTMGTSESLTLRADSTYAYEMQSSFMGPMSVKAEGKFERAGESLELKGTMTARARDGQKESTESGPHRLSLKLENGMLTYKDGKGDAYFFRREGTGPPPSPPELKLKASDPAAVALLRKVEKTYASLKTYLDTGTVKSQGGGFVAKDARFRTLFERPSKFRFEASQLVDGREFDRTEVTWDGSTCWWYTTEFGETTERPLGNALGIVSLTFGPEANLVPPLLMPDAFRGSGLAEIYPEISLLPDENLGDRACAVLQLRSKGAYATKLWIDKSTNMIVRLYEDLRDVTVTFEPSPNTRIEAAEFALGRRSKSD